MPSDVCGPAAKAELDYWELEDKDIEECCWVNYISYEETMDMLEKFELDERDKFHSVYVSPDAGFFARTKPRLWRALQDPYSSKPALVSIHYTCILVNSHRWNTLWLPVGLCDSYFVSWCDSYFAWFCFFTGRRLTLSPTYLLVLICFSPLWHCDHFWEEIAGLYASRPFACLFCMHYFMCLYFSSGQKYMCVSGFPTLPRCLPRPWNGGNVVEMQYLYKIVY